MMQTDVGEASTVELDWMIDFAYTVLVRYNKINSTPVRF